MNFNILLCSFLALLGRQFVAMNDRIDLRKYIIRREMVHLYPIIIAEDKLPSLHKAAKNGLYQVVIKLLSEGSKMNSINEYRQTALHFAAAYNCVETALTLLQRKCNPNVRCSHGYTPLHIAAALGHKEMVELLLAFGAHPYEQSNFDDTPVSLALAHGYEHLVSLMNQAEQVRVNNLVVQIS